MVAAASAVEIQEPADEDDEKAKLGDQTCKKPNRGGEVRGMSSWWRPANLTMFGGTCIVNRTKFCLSALFGLVI